MARAGIFWRRARRGFSHRLRLLAAAFGVAPRKYVFAGDQRVEHTSTAIVKFLNAAGRAAGVQVWDWDVVTDTLIFDSDGPQNFGGDARAARENSALILEHGIHAEDREHYRREFIKALKGEAPLSIDYRIVHKDGTAHPVQLRGEVFRNDKGHAVRVIGFTIDMTAQSEATAKLAAHAEQQRQAQLKIEQQAQQLKVWLDRVQLATETAGVGMWDWDVATGALSSDVNMAKIFPEADLRGVANANDFINKILHPDDREKFLATMQT